MHKLTIFSIAVFSAIAIIMAASCSSDARVIRAIKETAQDQAGEDEEGFIVVEPKRIEVHNEEGIIGPGGKTEYSRERQYGTLIDLTKINASNCEGILEDFKSEQRKLARDLSDDEIELKKEAQNLKEAEVKLNELLANSSSDEDDIERLERNVDDSRDYISKKESSIKDLERKLREISKTVDELEEECKRLKTVSR